MKYFGWENIKLMVAFVLAFLIVLSPLVVGYQLSHFSIGLAFSFVELATIILFYSCGKYDGRNSAPSHEDGGLQTTKRACVALKGGLKYHIQ